MVAVDEMKGKLLTLEQVEERLTSTEPLAQHFLSNEDKISFQFEPAWALALDSLAGTSPVEAVIRVNGTDHQLSKDAALQATGAFGLRAAYTAKVPTNLLESHINYWYSAGMGDKEFNMLSTGQNGLVAAFTRPTINPFSNKLLLDNIISGIRERYPHNEILADYKMAHSLIKTDIRLVIPEMEREISGGNMFDVPAGEADIWSGGIHLTNSLIGKSQTKLEGYMFRWWCTNGAITRLQDVGAWSRRGEHDELDVYEWAKESIDSVLGGLESQFDQVQALTQLKVGDNASDVVAEIFANYDVPVSQRQAILTQLLESPEELSMYSIMNAVTSAANIEGISNDRADKLMRIGGDIPSSTFDTLKAQVWREGHSADATAPNPYEVVAA